MMRKMSSWSEVHSGMDTGHCSRAHFELPVTQSDRGHVDGWGCQCASSRNIKVALDRWHKKQLVAAARFKYLSMLR